MFFKGKVFSSLYVNDSALTKFTPPTEDFEDVAHIRIEFEDRIVVVRGDPNQTFAEFILSLVERAEEPIEVVVKSPIHPPRPCGQTDKASGF